MENLARSQSISCRPIFAAHGGALDSEGETRWDPAGLAGTQLLGWSWDKCRPQEWDFHFCRTISTTVQHLEGQAPPRGT
jgi:hypothetical protein